MLQSMVLSETRAHPETTAARGAAPDGGVLSPVFVKPCDRVGVRREAVRNRLPNAAVKLCTSVRFARGTSPPRRFVARAAAAAEAAENPRPTQTRASPPSGGVAAPRETRARRRTSCWREASRNASRRYTERRS